jgi:glycosyltransferase involved in cell wall biosynthesis
VRVLYLTDRLSVRGGADQHLAQVVSQTVRTGHRVSIAFGRGGQAPREIDDVERLRIPGLGSRVDSGSRLDGLGRALDRADVVHVQNVMNPSALERATKRGRAVVTVQDHRFFCPGPGKTVPDGSACARPMGDDECAVCLTDRAYRRTMLGLTRRRLAALGGARIVVLSRYMAGELAAVGVHRARVIPPWVEPGPIRSGAGSAVMLGGRLVRHKAVLDGWRAWDRAGRPLPLVVAGAGPLEAELDGAVKLGWLDRGDLLTELRACRVLVFPARWQEPFGMLGLEALAQGTPVIAATGGGTSDWSARGCIEVEPGDVPRMAAAIEELAADPERAAALGRQGQVFVRERFAREPLAKALLDLYEEVAAS